MRNGAGCASSKTDSAMRSIDSSFRSLLGKIGRHSDFEDTQLFRFFAENVPATADQIRSLRADHTEKGLESDALERIKTLRSAPTTAAAVSGGDDVAAAAAVASALEAYAASLNAHLEREERALV
ncbi:unnamed protein product, partial [Hapterophycus canaliculatus]